MIISRWFKYAVIVGWLLLLLLLARRDFFIAALDSGEQAVLLQAKYQQYYGVHLHTKRIGWVMEDVRPVDGGYRIRQQASLKLKVINSVQPVDMDLHAELDSGMRLKSFQFTFSSPFYSTKAEGKTEGRAVHFTLDTGRTVIKDTVTLPETPLLPLNQRGYLLAKMSKAGEKLKAPFFDPFSLTKRESVITYKGPDKELIGGRVYNLHEFTESYSGMTTKFWLDEQGKIIKEESPAGFVFEAEPKFKAMNIEDSGNELLAAVAVKYSGALPPEDSAAAVYQLRFPAEAEVELNGGRQHFADGRLTVRKEAFPPQADGPEDCGANAAYLRGSRYVQAEDAKIIAKAKEIIGDVTDPVQQVRLLTDWVYANIEKRPVIGLPDALTTLDSRLGDCNEHAALFAALSRSLGIPTAIAAGVTLQKNAFYYHAWNEVCIQGQWISLDTTTKQLPADIYHLRFTRADVEGQIAIGGLLGKLEIEAVKKDAGQQ
jgi:transglutaminase-like putative cysteine protease